MTLQKPSVVCLLIWLACTCGATRLAAQCTPPTNMWVSLPQTSTTLSLKWNETTPAEQYQLRYWRTTAPTDKTIVEDFKPAPELLTGLKKYTNYSFEVRSKCNGMLSDWSAPISFTTPFAEGACGLPTGVQSLVVANQLTVQWASAGTHAIRYRLGTSSDWTVPPGAMAIDNGQFVLPGLAPGAYEIEVKRNCPATTSNYVRMAVTVATFCAAPDVPEVIPDETSATVVLLAKPGVSGYNVDYRPGSSGAWTNAGENIPPSLCYINPPFAPNSSYQVRIQAICINGESDFSSPASFTTLPPRPCLADKNFSKNMSAADVATVSAYYNEPSPYTYGSMIGVNDGGLFFRAFQNQLSNPITALTTRFRNFHTMDEDFDATLTNYAQNIKPKNVSPEGMPGNIQYNKGLYQLYHNTHGFTDITAAVELLQYSPQTWKEKVYQESDWSASGPDGMRSSFGRYVGAFIDAFAPAQANQNQWLAHNFQVGNEWWDYPVKDDYQNLLRGAHDAFVGKYGPKVNGKWRMSLVLGAFQAYRDANCSEMLRNHSNCGSALERHDFLGDQLDGLECNILADLDAIDGHAYSFKHRTLTWTYPEDPESEDWQIRNLAAFLYKNKNTTTGVLAHTRLWTTEYGFDSNPTTGVGVLTQNAYLIRGLLLHSRFHFERVYFYNAFDHNRPTDQYYTGLYGSSGFWQLGTNPQNSAWASPLPGHGATPKPAWYGMLDVKNRLGNHVFHQALVESDSAYVWLLTQKDGTSPVLVYWSPQHTTDANVHANIPLQLMVDWSAALPTHYTLDSTLAYPFAHMSEAEPGYLAATPLGCGSAQLNVIRRMPAIIPLKSCNACVPVSSAGSITAPVTASGNTPFDPTPIQNLQAASSSNNAPVQYQWQESSDNVVFVDIENATGLTYDPPALIKTTYFRRGARAAFCDMFQYTTSVTIAVAQGCATVTGFVRNPQTLAGCNADGEYYYELTLSQVVAPETVIFDGLPLNGLVAAHSGLNDMPIPPGNLQLAGSGKLTWLVSPTNGITQRLKLGYCNVLQYPEPVFATAATTSCSGTITTCSDDSGRMEERQTHGYATAGFTITPNPGRERVQIMLEGATVVQEVQCFNATGQLVLTAQGGHDRAATLDTRALLPGMYFIWVSTDGIWQQRVWVKQ